MEGLRRFLQALESFAQAHTGEGWAVFQPESEEAAKELRNIADNRLTALKEQLAVIKQEIEAGHINRGYTEKKIAEVREQYPNAIDWSLFEI